MTETLLTIRNLRVEVNGAEILHDISMDIAPGEVHVLMGPNGAGKSTLGNAIMGSPAYQVTGGQILLDGQDITAHGVDERSREGIFLSFQNPLEVPGITLSAFIRSALEQRTGKRVRPYEFRKMIRDKLELLQMDESYVDRDLNVGFSGGEKKKAEILQLLALQPRLAILDETDSGLDVDAVRTVSAGVHKFMEDGQHSLLIITHSTKILESLPVDRTHVLVSGQLVAEGDGTLVDQINESGFESYLA